MDVREILSSAPTLSNTSTEVLDPFMDRLDMSDKIALLSHLIVTFRSRVLDLFMDRLDMSVEIALCCCLKLTFRA